MSDGAQSSFWDTPRGQFAALGTAVLITVLLLFGNLGGIGIWEPWESNEIAVAQQYATRGAAPESTDPKAPSWNAAVPTFEGRPVERSLLKTVLLAEAVGTTEVDAAALGSLERRARLPMAFAAWLCALGMLGWLYRRFGALQAAVSTTVFVSLPAMYFGVHNLTAEIFFVATTSAAIITFAELMLDRPRRWLWGAAFGLCLALCVLDQRLLGLFLPLAVLGAFAAGEAMLGEVLRRRDAPSAPARLGGVELAGAAVAALGAALTVGWLLGTAPEPDAEIPVYARQIASVLLGALTILGLFWLGRTSKPGRAFWSLPGMLGLTLGVVAALVLARTYSAANPILLDGGRLFGDVRVLGYMLGNHVFENSLVNEHLEFDVVVRQVGFALFPWVALFPLGFAYVARAASTSDEDGEPVGMELFSTRPMLLRLLLTWIVAAAVVMAFAAAWQHYFYPAYVPIAAAIGLALTDASYWQRLRRSPLAGYAVGFVAVVLVLMLGKDLERFPVRFIETYLTLQEGFELPEDYSWGALFKPIKYGLILLFIAHFFGLVTWGVLAVRRLKTLPELWRALRARDWAALWGDEPTQPPYVQRMQEKEALRAQSGPIGAVARLVETPRGFAPLLAVVMAVVAAVFLWGFIPEVTNHVSQRGVFATYTRVAQPGEKLYGYQVSSRDNSVYLSDVETIRGATEFSDLVAAPNRFFAVIPRTKLAAINFEVRQKLGRNIHVLDARSSRLLLVSNQLRDGEEDVSFVNDKIVEGEPQVDFPVTFGESKKHPVFDGQLEMLGYSLDKKPGKDGVVAYAWGETMTITYYFRVLKRVPSSQKIFLHVDYPGTRINGDHVPNNGEFPTNYWAPGDVVKDVHPLKIDSYSTPGEYTLNMGFFLGSRRMKVEPREAHDGKDRITIGKIRVTSGL